MKDQATSIRQKSSDPSRRTAAPPDHRLRFYLALLLFISMAGLPILGVSSLRHRLQTRVQLLAEAMFDESYGADPIKIAVGEGGPFPEEHERERSLQPTYSDVTQMMGLVYQPMETNLQPVIDMTNTETAEPESADDQPDYGQGELERDAYDLLVKSNEKIAAMIEGNDARLSFKSWAAAPMEESTFWVNLIFTVTAEGVDAQYIWKVDLSTQTVEPLSSNARSIRPD